MKGIVLEIKNDEAAILSDDGAVSKVKNKNYEIGQVIILKQNKRFKSKLVAGAASLVAAMAIFATGAFAYYTPTSYVSLDVNPSIEYSVNMFDKVLVVKAVNDDGKDIIINLDLEHKDITKAVEKTIDELIEAGYITKDENAGVVIAVSNAKEDKAEKLVKELEENTQKHLDEMGETAKVEAEAVGKKRVEEARTLGVTPGKLNLVEKLKASSPNPDKIVIGEWLNKSVKEINKTIKANREQNREQNEEQAQVQNRDQNENKPIKEEKIKNSNKPVKEEKNINNNDTQADDDEEITNDDNSNNGRKNDEKSNNGKSENSKK